MKTELTKNAIELGFKPKYVPLEKDFFSLLLAAITKTEEECTKLVGMLAKDNMNHSLKILEKRIEVMALPISFTSGGKLTALALTQGNPGRMIALLIDCLTQHEDRKINPEMLCVMYAIGFYSEASYIQYVDTYLKTKTVKWSEVY